MFPQQIFCLCLRLLFACFMYLLSKDSSASAAFLSHQTWNHHHQCLGSVGGFISPLLLLGADATPSKQHRPIRYKLQRLRYGLIYTDCLLKLTLSSFNLLVSGVCWNEKSDHSWCSCVCCITAGKCQQSAKTRAANRSSWENENLPLTAKWADHVWNLTTPKLQNNGWCKENNDLKRSY